MIKLCSGLVSVWSIPVLLPLQQFPVGVDLHVQGQLYIQQLLVLAELSVHSFPQVTHLTLFGLHGVAVLVTICCQYLLQLSDTFLRGRHLRTSSDSQGAFRWSGGSAAQSSGSVNNCIQYLFL